jgi:hypothetical protein
MSQLSSADIVVVKYQKLLAINLMGCPMQTNEMPIPDPRVPLPLVLPQVIKSYLDSQRAENLYLILEHRLGLNGKTERSLEEVGSVLVGHLSGR